MRLFVSQFPQDASAAVGRADQGGDFPLHSCCEGGHEEVLSILTSVRPAPVIDVQDARGGTPFLRAVAHGHVSLACRLIDLGADPTWKDKDAKDAIDLVPHSLPNEKRMLLYEKLLSSGMCSMFLLCLMQLMV